MVDDQKPSAPSEAIQKHDDSPKSDGAAAPSTPITPEYIPAEKALEKLDKPEVLSLAAFFSSKMTLGPDPETAKVMADTEKHHESCRLDGYKANLKNQDEEGKRKHEYRMKHLNHDTLTIVMVLVL